MNDALRHTWAKGQRVISASRRTDVPGCYSTWFMNRVRRRCVAVPNPNNAHQISWLSLRPQDVIGTVFWTKNPRPLMAHLDEFDGYGFREKYYFQFTITAYPRLLEARTPDLEHACATFVELADRLGPSRVVWRYDPILFLDSDDPSNRIDEVWHLHHMDDIAGRLAGAATTCVISFVDVFRKTARNMDRALEDARLAGQEVRGFRDLPVDWGVLSNGLHELSRKHGLRFQTCAESDFVLERLQGAAVAGQCIDARRLADMGASVTRLRKDTGQRDACGCVASREIGMYDSCLHGCAFCYANSSSDEAVRKHQREHNPESAMLLGELDDEEAPGALKCHLASAGQGHQESLL